MSPDRLGDLVGDIATCRRCPRLVEWREGVAATKVARHRDSVYWGRPVPGFGDPEARLLLVGLAPAAHGANRTGRVFTGDNAGGSGEMLFAALHRAGYSPLERSRPAPATDSSSMTRTSRPSTAVLPQPTNPRPPSATTACRSLSVNCTCCPRCE